mmetsp:Transcript_9490/g.21728  ORF Transcript_9490/g.21728 Transcript_9490/m.21728 type:complete len:1307 (-) Transcript_9490:39-3959(-)|eukprot:CAMPEP_0114552832 /NCGR_PEP_ID=MMETSP0114-20121206/7331_1 /TAXON_ID=31324 /ORGANISM="Goniomonas sp, Strain m" /LENGTH=1306 /DNA_ID=CAMNT_0001737727 /DNA_START=44 /DNA_END=3964 /DNA_ORIENTATION=+
MASNMFVRRAKPSDAEAIEKLVGVEQFIVEKRWGTFSIPALIERSPWSCVCVEEDTGVVNAFASFHYFPNIPKLDPAKWDTWFSQKHGRPDLNVSNVFCMSMFLSEHLVEHDALTLVLRTTFTFFAEIDAVLLFLGPGVMPFSPIKERFQQVAPITDEYAEIKHSAFATEREQHVVDLRVRDALVEDHDDLVPVFTQQAGKGEVGDFFVAQLIQAQNERNRAIVAEAGPGGRAVGLMSVTTEVELGVVQEEYDIEPYDFLCKGYVEACEQVAEEHAERMRISREEFRRAQLRKLEERRRAMAEDRQRRKREEEAAAKAAAEALAAESGADGPLPTAEEEVDAEEEAAAAEKERLQQEEEEEAAMLAHMEALEEFGEDPVPKVDLSLLESNAFCITLFCLESTYEARCRDMLAYAFTLFPDKEYAIVTLPYTAPHFCLLRHFTPVTCRADSSFSHVLYIFHRAALLTPVTFSPLEPATHADSVLALVDGLPSYSIVAAALAAHGVDVPELQLPPDQEEQVLVRDKDKKPDPRAWKDGDVLLVGEVAGQVMSVAVFRPCTQVGSFTKFFDCDSLVQFGYYDDHELLLLTALVINPIFTRHAPLLLREAMRRLGGSVLFHAMQPEDVIPEFVFHDFTFVRPRRQPTSTPPADIKEELTGLSKPDCDPDCSALLITSHRLLPQSKHILDARIVVVGASDAGLGLMEALLHVPYLTFRHLVVISQGGLPRTYSNYNMASLSFSPVELWRQAFEHRVQVIDGLMVGVDRAGKVVHMEDGTEISYDHLILTPGLQDYMGMQLRDKEGIVDGLFSPHNLTTAQSVDEFLGRFSQQAEKAIVYGQSLDCLVAVNQLIEKGVKGNLITLALTGRYDQLLPIVAVRDKVWHELKTLGVTVVEHHKLLDVETSDTCLRAARFSLLDEPSESVGGDGAPGEEAVDDAASTEWQRGPLSAFDDGSGGGSRDNGSEPPQGDRATAIQNAFSPSVAATRETRLPCGLLLSFGQRRVNPHVFGAVNSNSLVFDGRLVVDGEFRTNDPVIFGGGSLVKFQRKLLDRRNMAELNSREAGQRLAESVLRVVDPYAKPREAVKAPPLQAPKGELGVLPGGLQLLTLTATMPDGLKLLRDGLDDASRARTGVEGGHGGRHLETDGASGYFKLQLDAYARVSQLTILTPPGQHLEDPWAWTAAMGLPVAMMNDIVNRVDKGVTTDLLAFLQQPWAKALFHDQARQFSSSLLQEVTDMPEVMELIAAVRSRIESDSFTAEKVGDPEELEALPHAAHQLVEERLMDFLTANSDHLAMYLTAQRADAMNKDP